MSNLWTPPGARPPRATLPEGDVTLANGLILVLDHAATPMMQEEYRRSGSISAGMAVYVARTGMLVMATVDATVRFGDLLHCSISYRDRNPSWREIRLVKDAFYGADRDAMIVLPRERDYINVHQHCFHLWEMPQAWGIR
jgi:hypothetical protein